MEIICSCVIALGKIKLQLKLYIFVQIVSILSPVCVTKLDLYRKFPYDAVKFNACPSSPKNKCFLVLGETEPGDKEVFSLGIIWRMNLSYLNILKIAI